MTAMLIVAPAAEPVSLAEAKAHLRLETDDEDGLVATLIEAARREVEASTRRKLVTQTWRVFLDDWPKGGMVEMPIGPLQRVLSVMVFDDMGEGRELAASSYVVDLAGVPARLKVRGAARPGQALNGIEIDVEAGYGEPQAVPAPLCQAVLMLVAHWFEHREAAGGALQTAPLGIERALAPYRALSL